MYQIATDSVQEKYKKKTKQLSYLRDKWKDYHVHLLNLYVTIREKIKKRGKKAYNEKEAARKGEREKKGIVE